MEEKLISMKSGKKAIAVLSLVLFFLCAGNAYAHQPRIVESETTKIENPEVSQAFYGQLEGKDDVFEIEAKDGFELYVNLLIPDISGARKDFAAEIYEMQTAEDENMPGQTKDEKRTLAVLQSDASQWTVYDEPWGGDKYFKGPEYKDTNSETLKGVSLDPGKYYIRVYNRDDQGKYALAIGTKEEMTAKEAVNTLVTLPKLKADYWGKSPITAYFNLTGVYLFATLLIVVVCVVAYKKIRKRDRKASAVGGATEEAESKEEPEGEKAKKE